MQTAPDAVTRFGTHVYSGEHHSIATAGSCIITYSMRPPDARYFAAWHAAVARLTEQQPGLLSVVTIIDSGAATPDESTRKLIRAAMHRYAPLIERFAYVVQGRGFGAAALRSAIALVNLAARTPYRQKVFASVEEAGAWLAREPSPMSSGIDATALSSLARTMRAKLDAPARAV